jgi:hypothetical protein
MSASAAGVRWTAALSAAAVALTGCGAGNDAPTSRMETAISGINVDAGDLALRDLQVDFGRRGVYEEGQAAPLRVWISNQGDVPVVLEAVVSPDAEAVTLATEEVLTEETPGQASPTADDSPTAAETETPEGDESPSPEGDAETGVPEGDESPSPEGDDATATPGEDDATESPDADASPTETPGGDDAAQLLGEREFTVEIAPASFVRLAPTHGSFLLLEGLKKEVDLGSTVEVSFIFSNGEEVTVDLPVGEPAELASRSYFEPDEAHAE